MHHNLMQAQGQGGRGSSYDDDHHHHQAFRINPLPPKVKRPGLKRIKIKEKDELLTTN